MCGFCVGDGIFDWILDGCNCFMSCLTLFTTLFGIVGIGFLSWTLVWRAIYMFGGIERFVLVQVFFHLDIVCVCVAVCSAL